jgi:hypothetical protein
MNTGARNTWQQRHACGLSLSGPIVSGMNESDWSQTGPGTCSIPQGARRLGWSTRRTRAAARAGVIPALKVNGRYVLLTEPLERMLAGEPRDAA